MEDSGVGVCVAACMLAGEEELPCCETAEDIRGLIGGGGWRGRCAMGACMA